MKHYEEQLRSVSQKELEFFSNELHEALEIQTNKLLVEKVKSDLWLFWQYQNNKISECKYLQDDIKKRMEYLSSLSVQLDKKSHELENQYEHVVNDIQQQYDLTVSKEKERLENEIKKKMEEIILSEKQIQPTV